MANVNPYQSAAIKNLAYPAPQGPAVTGLKAQTGMGVQKVAQAATNNLTNPSNSAIVDSRVAGAALTAQAGQSALANAGQQVQTSARTGQAALGTMEAGIKNDLALRKLSLDANTNAAAARLGRLSEDVKNTVLDETLAFQRDKAGRTLFNQRQLADFALLKARGIEDLENFKATSAMYHERKMQILNVSYKQVTAALEAMTKRSLSDQDMHTKDILTRAKVALEKKKRDAESGANGRQQNAAIGAAIGTVVVGAVGAFFSWGAATVPAAAAGGYIGGAIGGSIG